MCGIAGWVSYESDLRTRPDIIESMTATLERRGPDDSGTWLRHNVALGHRRLAVIDLPGGAQPMTFQSDTGAVTLVYSGEVYNFVELRKDLVARGHQFHTNSDTEVVLLGYIEWGDSIAEKLNGMYALVLWDERTRKLLMLRDRLGIKPLFYYPTPDGVLFGSEPKTILAHPSVSAVVDADGLQGLLSFGKRPGWSLWKGMYEVEPGTIVFVTDAGIRTRRYWTLPTVPHVDERDATIEHVRSLLTDAVQRQLVADVPRCVLLSGGLDSSGIAGLAAEKLTPAGERLRTYSVDYPGYEDNFEPIAAGLDPDGPYIREMANMVNSAHRNIVLDTSRLTDPEVRRIAVRARDMPTPFDVGEMSLYLLCDAIRNESTVALSGESADELFGGYRWFHDESARYAKAFPWDADWHQQQPNHLTAILRRDIVKNIDIHTYVADEYSTAVSRIEHVDDDNVLERQMRVASNLFLTRFLPRLLDRKDRMSMATGLEVRVPYCDHRLVEYVYNAPWSLKNFDGKRKSLLRHAVKHAVAPSILQRAKAPYPMTQDPAYASSLKQQSKEILSQSENPVFNLVSRDWLHNAVESHAGVPSEMLPGFFNWVLQLNVWFNMYQPELELN